MKFLFLILNKRKSAQLQKLPCDIIENTLKVKNLILNTVVSSFKKKITIYNLI